MRVHRTPEERFAPLLPSFPYEPRYIEAGGLRSAYVETGLGERGVALLLHGEPTWGYLYRKMIGPLAAAGFRCVVPDHIGFGRSDKVLDDDWYTTERHIERTRLLIETLDLRRIMLVCQDWGGPIGLRQAVDMPDRFVRLVIMNTWLHHEGYEYSQGARNWRAMATNPEALGGDMPTGRIVAGTLRRPGHDLEAVTAAYDLPFEGYDTKAGARRFPACIPFGEPIGGNAADQQRCFDALLHWTKPVHFAWGDADPVFPIEWGERWASLMPGATFDRIADAGHFLQEDAGEDVAAAILARIGAG